ncbi:OLC1v1010145C1 [Oldenlandia corymbosa var. corymbosa]|uniref:OLC1v1010145C1 n=1 Tax=Oldenlandia corymbosa var. corymbosa TaxID=529605 RepID=A0AAV1DQP1_OLDCO|nr:OLC1v1010145C1 [Oldenlandia corymbosa var. corymbosa]
MKKLGSKFVLCKFLFSNSSLPKPRPTCYSRSTRLFSVTSGHFKNDPSLQSSKPVSDCRNLVSFLARCRTTRDLKTLLSALISQGLISPEILTKHFIKRCYDLGDLELVFSAAKLVGTKSRLLTQNLMLKWLCDNGLFEDVLIYFEKSRFSGCPSDNYTFPLVLKACAALKNISLGRILHGVVLRKGYVENVVVQTAIVGFYSKNGRISTARLMLDRMPDPDVVAWNALISGCSANGYDEEILELFQEALAIGLRPNVSTLASLIPVCSRFACIHAGKSLHGLAIKSGFIMDESLIPCLISMYANCGNFQLAKSIFDSFHDKSIAIWNSMISASTGNQRSNHAFELFLEMLQDGLHPNMITFVSIVPACDNFTPFWHGDSLHAWVVKYGLVNHNSVGTALLSMYAKVGDIKSVERVFNSIQQKNLLSWNSLVSAYVSNSLFGASFNTFREMQLAGVNPDEISVISILSSCSELDEAFLMGKSVHSFILKKGIEYNLNVCNALLAFYSGSCSMYSAFGVFNRMSKQNIISWNIILSGCLYSGKTEIAFGLFHRMLQEDIGFDLITLKTLLPACNENGGLMLGVSIHGYSVKTGFDSDVSFTNALVSMYLGCGDIESGTYLFENMTCRNVISWNALLSGHCQLNMLIDIAGFIQRMTEETQKPNYITLLSLLQLCNISVQGKAIHAYAVRAGFMQETPLLTSLMLMYARFGSAKSCQYIFQMGQNGSLSMWNAVISSHLLLTDAVSAFSFFIDMLRREVDPDCVTLLCVISVCVQINNLTFSDAIFAYLIRKGFDEHVSINNALIDLYARCGDISVARRLFELLPGKDAISWSVMINGYGLHGDGQAALSLFSCMRASGMKPDGVTYLNILSACSHAGLVEEGRTIFHSMIDDGILPRMDHYSCFVGLLCRTGYLDEAYDILRNLPCKFSEEILVSLLGACLTHGNIQLGEELGKMIPGLQSTHSGLYVMLHNIYAAAGRWTDANRIRSEMEEKKLTKVAGVSMVEENG